MGAIEEASDRDFGFDSRAASDFQSLPPNGYGNGYGYGHRSAAVEMVAVQQPFSYTSLKDLLPAAAAAAAAVVSPSYERRQSWEEIPIKNPLVQKGAWAYLRPMKAVPASGRRGTWAALKDWCRCVGFLNDVVLGVVRGVVKGLLCNKDEFGSESDHENADDKNVDFHDDHDDKKKEDYAHKSRP